MSFDMSMVRMTADFYSICEIEEYHSTNVCLVWLMQCQNH